MSAANPETPNSTICREASTQSSSAAASQGWVLPEGKIMPNSVFVGGIDDRTDEAEIRSCFGRYGSVKEVKMITNRSGVSKGYGFVSFVDDVDVQKIVESQIHLQGKKLKLGPAIRKQKFCARHVQPCPLVFNPPPPPQFQNVWRNPNTETRLQPLITLNPVTQYVQAYPAYPNSAGQVITGYQLLVYNYQAHPTYPNSAVHVITGYHLPVYNYQAYSTYPNSPGQVITRYQLPLYNFQAYSTYPDSPDQFISINSVIPGYQLPVYNYQAYRTYPNAPVQVITRYQSPVYNYQAFPAYPNSPIQVTTGYQLPVYNYQVICHCSGLLRSKGDISYPDSPGQVTTGYQLPVYNYQMPPQWPVGEQKGNLWTEAYRWWYLVCLIQRAD
ncbi:deleted in azoospermia protein 3-like [Pongo abelii]|uniref:deleted in azoospermia protein 3-like n=1 Tax=Pongo abelii TaxID=9601 RepID=UPI003007E0CD